MLRGFSYLARLCPSPAAKSLLIDHEYRYTDVFPQLSKDGKLVVTEKDEDSSIVILNPDGSDKQRVFHARQLLGRCDAAIHPDAEQAAWMNGAKSRTNGKPIPLDQLHPSQR